MPGDTAFIYNELPKPDLSKLRVSTVVFSQRRPATQATPFRNHCFAPSLAPVPAHCTPFYQVYRNTYLCNLCLLTLTVSFAADIYPAVPSHNVPLSAALLWASCNVDGVRALRRRSFAYALSGLVLISLFIDVDFLASALKVNVRSPSALLGGKHGATYINP